MDSLSKDDSVVLVTTQLDNDNLPIMITIKPNGKGIYEAETLESNYITSIYGKDNFEKFIDRNIKENKILYFDKEKIQSLERFARLQLSGTFLTLNLNKLYIKVEILSIPIKKQFKIQIYLKTLLKIIYSKKKVLIIQAIKKK